MWRPGIAEIVIVLIIVILLFGPGRIAKISKELGSSITAFKEGLNENNKDEEKEKNQQDSDTETKKDDQ